jgi:hypothetical protein
LLLLAEMTGAFTAQSAGNQRHFRNPDFIWSRPFFRVNSQRCRTWFRSQASRVGFFAGRPRRFIVKFSVGWRSERQSFWPDFFCQDESGIPCEELDR